MDIYTLIITFPYDEDDIPWSRTIEVKEDFTLNELHKYIQELVEFDDDHLYEFYLGKNPENRAHLIPEDSKLNQFYPANGLKLYYLFDFGDSWLFEIRKSSKKKHVEENKKYPALIESIGINPMQYPEYDE